MDLFGNSEIRALSWKQPYGTAMLHEKIETRKWPTSYRGLVLICTSQAAYNEAAVKNISGEQMFVTLCNMLHTSNDPTLDLNGYAIAVGYLSDCRLMVPNDELKTFVSYRAPWKEVKLNKNGTVKKVVTKQIYCHIYTNVRPIKPFPWNGSQGWKRLSAEEMKRIEYL